MQALSSQNVDFSFFDSINVLLYEYSYLKHFYLDALITSNYAHSKYCIYVIDILRIDEPGIRFALTRFLLN